MFSVHAAAENVPTSKSYVDSALTQKQDTIERATGANQALTNTGVAGEYGTKDIYDSTGEYATQQDALIDAVTMNTAVQNAIDSEFQCVEWVDNDPTKDCLLMMIGGQNLFNPATNPIEQGWIDNGVNGPENSVYHRSRVRTNGYIDIQPNTRYEINSNLPKINIYIFSDNGQYRYSNWRNTPSTVTSRSDENKMRIVLTDGEDYRTAIVTPSDVEYLIIKDVSSDKIYIPSGN